MLKRNWKRKPLRMEKALETCRVEAKLDVMERWRDREIVDSGKENNRVE